MAILNRCKALALTLCVGVVPFFVAKTNAAEYLITESNTQVYSEVSSEIYSDGVSSPTELAVSAAEQASQPKAEKRWLDDYPRRIGLTISANATLSANYIWRGLYVGGPSIQPTARLNYEGVFVDMWWNLGANNWVCDKFIPEVDISLGLDRWGFQLYWLHMHYFDSPFFKYANAAPGNPGNTSELRAKYTVSSKLPLTIMWCTRFAGRDGYLDGNGDLKRAYSSYLEIKYSYALPYSMAISATVGMTPWKSMYTGFEGDFAVTNIDIALSKEWQVKQCSFSLAGNVMINPWRMTKENVRWDVHAPWDQRINANLTFGVSWQYKHNPSIQ